MKYCSICDEEFPKDLMFCPRCGTFLKNYHPNETTDGNLIINKNDNQKFDITKPGVYKIENKRTGEVFVSYGRNMKNQIENQENLLKKDKFPNKHVQEDYNNGDRFNFIILEELDSYDKHDLKLKVVKWIRKEDSYNYGYNRNDGWGYDPNLSILYSPGNRLKDKKEE